MTHGVLPVLVLAVAISAATGCAARDPVGGAIAAGQQVYAPGTPRAAVRRADDASTFVLADEPPEDRFAAAVVARQSARGVPRPHGYETFDLVRYRSASNPMSYGLDRDYVFYDEAGRVSYAARRRLD